jgi:hypothetical protein
MQTRAVLANATTFKTRKKTMIKFGMRSADDLIIDTARKISAKLLKNPGIVIISRRANSNSRTYAGNDQQYNKGSIFFCLVRRQLGARPALDENTRPPTNQYY